MLEERHGPMRERFDSTSISMEDSSEFDDEGLCCSLNFFCCHEECLNRLFPEPRNIEEVNSHM